MASVRSQTTAERVAYNEAAFREANESIRDKAAAWDMEGMSASRLVRVR
jgi:hypothetical protein